MPAAILFDLDCTLTDRRRSVEALAALACRHFRFADIGSRGSAEGGEAGRMTEAVVTASMLKADGDGYRPRAAFFADLRSELPWADVPAQGVLESFWRRHFPACTRSAEGLHETLRSLRRRGIRLGVVSNGGAAGQRRKIETLGIAPFLSAAIISGAVAVRKPDQRIFRIALDALGVSAGRAWFVGDDPWLDILGAAKAGLTPVWLHRGRNWPVQDRRPKRAITCLPDLLALLPSASPEVRSER